MEHHEVQGEEQEDEVIEQADSAPEPLESQDHPAKHSKKKRNCPVVVTSESERERQGLKKPSLFRQISSLNGEREAQKQGKKKNYI